MLSRGDFEDIFSAALWETEPPAIPTWIEWQHIPKGFTHCETCLTLDGCWFVDKNKPQLPQHPFCHCRANPNPLSRVLHEATAGALLSKFDPYLFDPQGVYKHGKEKMFKSWGYSISDSEWLRKELERQGLEKYIAGQYTLGRLDDKGQRISIQVELPRKDKEGAVSFITGWMVFPNGHIQLATPYGGK